MRKLSRRVVIVLVTLAFGIGIPFGMVLASHQFGDVPNSNPFHADIDAIADAGVTGGCGGGNYCPKANVTREQMAAFLNRLGALGPGKVPVVNADKVDGLDSLEFGLAGVRASADGGVVQWFNRTGGEPTIEHAGTGLYRITFPGRSYSINTNFVGSATLLDGPGSITINSIGGTRVQIRTWDGTGTATDLAFTVVVFDASTSG